MTARRARPLALFVLLAAAALPGAAAAQSYIPQPQSYMLSTDPSDGRALWVQPASLVRHREATLAGMFTLNQAAGHMRLGQYGVTIASGVLALGWQHDHMSDSVKNDVFSAGLAGGTPTVSVGFDRRWYHGTNTRDGSWDIGGRYQATQALELSAVWRDISSPVIVGDTLHATLVPAAAFSFWRGRARVGADWELLTDGWTTSAVRVGATVPLPARLSLSLRSEMSGRLHQRSFAFAVTWGATDARLTGFRQWTHSPDVDRMGAWASAVSDPSRPRRFGGR